MYIDFHVHFRDFNQKHKETIKHGLEVARDSGVDAVGDMSNTDPPLQEREIIVERLRLAKDADVPEVFYGVHGGLTSDPEQIKRIVSVHNEFIQVIGLKLFAGHSTGDLGVTTIDEQCIVYNTLAREGYTEVLVDHCEKESEMNHTMWNPILPFTHCHARPEKAEIESVKDQIELARYFKFKGKLHIAHISSPQAVDLVQQAKSEGLDISCGICPHHFIYDWEQMYDENGILWKMNPPLRSPESRERMLNYLRDGKIDWIETDHAPHSLDEKVNKPFMSGIPGVPWWNLYEEFLRKNNFSDSLIEKLMFKNAAKRYGLDIQRSKRKIVDRRGDYPFNAHRKLEIELGYK